MDAAFFANFDSICRTCMHILTEGARFATTTVEQPEVQCHSIFDTVSECGTMRIVELLAATTPQLHVNLCDELSKKICRECFQLLLRVYRFQKMCIQSEQQMREILAKRCPVVKIINPTLLTDSTAERKEFSTVDNIEEEIETGAVNDALETPLANDPLHNAECLKREEFIDENEYVGGTSSSGTSLIDPNLMFAVGGTPKTTYELGTTTAELLSEEYVYSDKKSDINKRKERVNKESPIYSCNLCNKLFSHRRFLRRHLKRHEKWEEKKNLSEKPDKRYHLKCDICNRRFSKPESLHKHNQIHNEGTKGAEKKKIYSCDLCDNTYCSKRTLRYHKNRRHSAEPIAVPKRHICEFCNKGFQFRTGLVDHLRTHTGEKPYLCSLCGKSFKSSSNLEQHFLRHSGVKRYECPDCPQKFACSSDLSKHRTIHRSVKPHICDICGTSFPKSNQLKTHKMYHMGIKPYKCEYCDMRFVLMDKQRRHMRTHTGEKPYKCKFCERAFAQSNDLVKHLRNHIGENVYTCELCPSAFRLANELRSHFASHRNDDEETRKRNLLALKEEDASLRLRLRGNGGLSIINS